MNTETLEHLQRWLALAFDQLNEKTSECSFLRDELSEIRLRVRDLGLPSFVPKGETPRSQADRASAKGAIDAAVALIRAQAGQLSTNELVVLSKLLVIQSLLCTPRFESLC